MANVDEHPSLLSDTSPSLPNICAAAISHSYLLPETEQRSIRTLISNYENDLGHLDLEIARAQAILNGFISQRKTIVAQIHSCQQAIAPHRKLPDELLAEIFVRSGLDIFLPISESDSLRTTPYNILRVCWRWNHVTLGIRQLWNSLQVNLDYCSARRIETFANIADRVGLPIISLDIYCHHEPSQFLQAMRDLMKCSGNRLQNLTVYLGALPQLLFELSPGDFDHLEVASIGFDVPPVTRSPSKIALLQDACKLREFTLKCTEQGFHPFSPFVFLLPWAELTRLDVSNSLMISPTDAHALLRQCRSLVSCNICIASSESSFRAPSPTLVLPTLKKLQLLTCGTHCSFLQGFVFPGLIALQLEHLYKNTLTFYISPTSWEIDFYPFLSCSSNLRSLEIHHIVPESIVQNILLEVPRLTSLLLCKGNLLTGGTIGMITIGNLVPRLEHLTCCVEMLSEALDMLESRLNGSCAAIGNASIFFQKCCVDWKERVEGLKQSGVDIVVTCSPPSSYRPL